MLGIVHVIVGLQVHMNGKFWLYFVPPPDAAYRFPLRVDAFGLSNYAGLAAGLILLMLLALSNNAALRSLGALRWKRLQRWNYAVAGLTVVHGALYQLLEKRTAVLVTAFAFIVLMTLALQCSGRLRKNSTATGG